MAIKFTPSGSLDLSTDPSDLGGQVAGKSEVSGEMTRCTNLDLSRPGLARCRRGITQLSSTAVAGTAHLVEHSGSRYEFTSTAIYRNEASIATGMSGDGWSTVQYNAYNVETESVFATNGTDKKRITGSTVAEWGIDAPTSAPTVNSTVNWVYTHGWEEEEVTGRRVMFGTDWEDTYTRLYNWEADLLDDSETIGADSWTKRGTFWFDANDTGQAVRAVYTYVRKSGLVVEAESNPSPASEIVSPVSALYLSMVSPSDSQVTHIRVYRTLDGGTSFLYAGEVEVSELTVSLNRPAASLGTEVSENNDRIPDDVVDLAGPDFNGVLFAAVGNKVYWSLAKQPESWPAEYYVEVGPPQHAIRALEMHNGSVYAVTGQGISQLQGTGANSFFPIPMSSITGTLSKSATLEAVGSGVFHLGTDGLYRFTGNADVRADRRFLPILEGTTVGSVPGMVRDNAANCLLLAWAGKLYFGFPTGTETYARHFLVADLETGRMTHHDYGRAFRCWTVDATNDRIIAADTSGNVWHLEDLDASQAAISWEIQSKDFTDAVRRHFPRWARHDVDGTATASILLDDTVHQTHAITSREPKKRHIGPGNGYRMAVRTTGTGPVSFYQQEVE